MSFSIAPFFWPCSALPLKVAVFCNHLIISGLVLCKSYIGSNNATPGGLSVPEEYQNGGFIYRLHYHYDTFVAYIKVKKHILECSKMIFLWDTIYIHKRSRYYLWGFFPPGSLVSAGCHLLAISSNGCLSGWGKKRERLYLLLLILIEHQESGIHRFKEIT